MKVSEEPHLFLIALCAVVGFFTLTSVVFQALYAVACRLADRHDSSSRESRRHGP